MSSKPTAGKQTRTTVSAAQGGRVAIVGSGMAGLSAALRLAQCGFAVTVFEQDEVFGGNTSSKLVNGTEHDVYPHMFPEWYDNFWNIYERELGLSRETHFDPRPGAKILKKGEQDYGQLFNPTSIKAAIANVRSGVLSPAEMFLLGFSGLDLAAFPFDRSAGKLMEMLDVNGFIYSRGYATEDVAEMQNYLLTLVWSIESSSTAAATYQNFLRHNNTFPDHAPFCWLLKGSLQSKLIEPFADKLRSLGCSLRNNTKVQAVRIVDEMPVLYAGSPDSGKLGPAEQFDHVLFAIPAEPLREIVMCRHIGLPGHQLIHFEPDLSNLQRLSYAAIPVVDLYLKRKLEGFPKEHVGLAASKYGLTVLDFSQLWEGTDFAGRTALVVAASIAPAIPSVEPHELGELMVRELAEYYPDFRPGKHWGDPDCDIDWDRTCVRTNQKNKLFLNNTGSWVWRPRAAYASLPRVCFAGDIVQTEVDMATVEGAIESGIQAAAILQAQDAQFGGHGMRGAPIRLTPHTVYSTASFRAAQLFFLPFAYGSFAIVAWQEFLKRFKSGNPRLEGNDYALSDYMLLVPMQYTIDWWKSAYWFGRALIEEPAELLPASIKAQLPGTEAMDYDDDRVIGLAEALLLVAGEVLNYAFDKDRAPPAASKEDAIAGIAELAGNAIDHGLKLFGRFLEGAATTRPEPGGRPRRRARIKP